MKRTFTALLTLTLLTGIASTTLADRERNNALRRRAVETVLEEIGGKHNPEKMKVTNVGSSKIGDTYFHIYCGTLRQGYRIIIFDNTPKYLGYYDVDYEPMDVGEGEILLDNSEGTTTDFTLPIGENGPYARVQIDGIPVKFVKAPVKEEPKKEDGEEGAAETKHEYREWKISFKDRVIPVTAIFVKYEDKKVFIMDSKSGSTKGFPLSALSADDHAYLKSTGVIQ